MDQAVSLRDIAATVAQCAGLGPRSPFPGRPLTRGGAEDVEPDHEPDPVPSEVQHITVFPRTPVIPCSVGPVTSLVRWDHVYIRGDGGCEELYNLASDPHEVADLVGTPGSRLVLDRFRTELERLSRR